MKKYPEIEKIDTLVKFTLETNLTGYKRSAKLPQTMDDKQEPIMEIVGYYEGHKILLKYNYDHLQELLDNETINNFLLEEREKIIRGNY